jgi:hypothetical protein
MKILYKGQILDERLNRAQRLIRLGLATIYIEPVKPKKEKKTVKAELEFDGIEEISIKPKVKVKKVEETEEKKSEDTAITEQEYSSE